MTRALTTDIRAASARKGPVINQAPSTPENLEPAAGALSPSAAASAIAAHDARYTWRPVRFLNLYRIVLAALFTASFYLKPGLPILGQSDPALFEITGVAYLVIAIIASFIIQSRKLTFNIIIYALVLVDILALTLLMHASGGIESGLGMLLVVSIAGNSLLLDSRTSNLFAAIAAIAVLVEQVFAHLDPFLQPNYTQAGILGAALFATAFVAYILSSRIRESEALAAQRGVDLANLAQLNQHVLQRMQSGIIVVDTGLGIRLMNESAWHMLGLAGLDTRASYNLALVSPELAGQLQEWRRGALTEPRMFKPGHGPVELLPSMMPLGVDERAGTLIFLEDTLRMAQQAQQIKLASLGRLTASIAHEIRNPLGAISHAEQLLNETAAGNPSDKRLLDIIHANTLRVNAIIENVLQLSRRGPAEPTQLPLLPWLEHFVAEFSHTVACAPADIGIEIEPADCSIVMDPSQLHQVLWNLCSNGLRYSPPRPGRPRLTLRGGRRAGASKPYLDVIDYGPGINADALQHIFEPFYTTENKGSGLGLYIARELCQINKAQLGYRRDADGNSCFRIEFRANPPATTTPPT